MRLICIVNYSNLIPAEEFSAGVAAVAKQVQRDFTPAWGLQAQVVALQHPAAGVEAIYLVNSSGVQGALGFHSVYSDLPYGVIDIDAIRQSGDVWTATLSHEVLEEIADPWCSLCAQAQWAGSNAMLAYESADPVENDEYTIDGVRVSNFVTPKWFVPGPHSAGTKFDYMGNLSAPLTLRPGGYQSYTTDMNNWQDSFGDSAPSHQKTFSSHQRRGRRRK